MLYAEDEKVVLPIRTEGGSDCCQILADSKEFVGILAFLRRFVVHCL